MYIRLFFTFTEQDSTEVAALLFTLQENSNKFYSPVDRSSTNIFELSQYLL